MRCTDCHREVRPVVAIDIDGTLGDYHLHFFQFAEGWLGKRVPRDYDGSVDIATFLGLTKDVYRRIKLAYRQGGMKRTMPALSADIGRQIKGLRDDGIEVWIATSRPYNRLDNIDPDTVEWLRRQGISYDGLLYDDNKVDTLIGIVGKDRIVSVLDDLPTVYDRAREHGLDPVQMATRYNQAVRRPISVGTMAAAASVLRSRAERWSQR